MKKILIFILLVLVTGSGYGYYLFNKKSDTVVDTKPYLVINAPELLLKFKENQQSISDELLSKTIQVKGIVTATEGGSKSAIILLNEGIKCEIDIDKNPPFVKGDTLIIKGIYSGFDDMFNEISLKRCYIVY